MKNVICYEIEERKEDYRLEIISCGKAGLFFDSSFAKLSKSKLKCFSDVSSFAPICSYVEMPCRAVLSILTALIRGMISAMDRYILPWDYVVSTRSVYADRTGEKIKIIYIPQKAMNSNYSISSVLAPFCEELSDLVSAEEKELFAMVKEVIANGTLRPEECLRELVKLRKELCGSLDLCR